MSQVSVKRRQLPKLRLLLGLLAVVMIALFLESHGPGGEGAWFGAFVFTIYLAPILGLWLIYSLFILCRRPEQRQRLWIGTAYAIALTGIVAGGLSDIAGCVVMADFAKKRAIAEQVISSVEVYRKQHAHYPKTLDEAHITTGQAFHDWGLSYSTFSNGYHELHYLGPIPFSWYGYSFEDAHWKLQLD